MRIDIGKKTHVEIQKGMIGLLCRTRRKLWLGELP